MKSVIIIGAGISGLVAAIMLKRAGYAVKIIEKRKPGENVGGGLAIWPAGTRILYELGLQQALQQITGTISEVHYATLKGQKINVVPVEKYLLSENIPVLFINRRKLLEILVNHLDSEDIIYQQAVTHIAYHDQTYHLMTDTDEQYSADILVGADGINSKVTAWLNPQLTTQKEYSGHYSLGGIVKDFTIKNNFIVGHQLTCVSFPCKIHYYTIMFYPVDKPDEVPQSWGSAIEWLRPQSSEVQEILDHISPEQNFCLPAYESKIFASYSANDSCFIIGDAAHAISPMSGIVTSFCIEDAYHLCNSIDVAESEQYNKHMRERSLMLKNFSKRHFTDRLRADEDDFNKKLQLMSTDALFKSAQMLAQFTQGHI